MPATRRFFGRLCVVVSGLVVAGFVGAVPHASAVTAPKPLNDTRLVGSAPVEVGFPIQYFGLVADLSGGRAHLSEQGRTPFGQARFRVDGRWTPWRTLGQDGAQSADQFTGALVSVNGADAYQVRGVSAKARNWRAAAINTTDGPSVEVGRRTVPAATAAPTCMSRADWGADESISGWARGDTQAFSPVQVVTVHHTAGLNDPNQDYAATVRAIYSYHVQSNGWSDIGYQYLVDGHGIVYEGRSTGHTSASCLSGGGDGSDFAHEPLTDAVVTGAHVAGYNSGNAGIAMMGCFESTSSACTGDPRATDAALDTLESTVTSLAGRHGLNPVGTVHYVNPATGATKEVDTISGHRDYGTTACPGDNLYAWLPTLRRNVASRLAGPTPDDPAVVAFRAEARTVRESVGTANLAVTRAGNTTLPATVGYEVTSGTATPGSDFTLSPGTLTFAPGETTTSIPLTVQDDDAREGAETIVIALSDQGPGVVLRRPTSTTVTIAPSDQQPDGLISTTSGSGFVGDNVYNSTGRDQTRTVTARRTQTRVFYVRVANDGNTENTFTVKGTGALSGSRVRYFSGTTDITKAMRSSEGWSVSLLPGANRLLNVRISVLRTAAFDSSKSAVVRASWSGDGARTDAVKAVVRVTR